MLQKLTNAFEKWRPMTKIRWRRLFVNVYLHLCIIYVFCSLFKQNILKTFIFNIFLGTLARFSVTLGYHRLWSHRCYKAKLPLRIFLSILCSIAGQGSIYEWCLDHRVHHRYSETLADPYNIKRGFFFAHMGWIMCERHSEFAIKAKKIPMKDLEEDSVVMFNLKFYNPLLFLISFYLPTMIPVWYWGDSILNSFMWTCARYILVLHSTFLINSVAHTFGTRPCDKHIAATNGTLMYIFNGGEGYHNFHHAFPWDYRLGEFGYSLSNMSRYFIDFMAFIGQAYDLKTANPETVKNKIASRGDGTMMEIED